jgi:acetylornithine deacetylase/succinyl-diaminopimelate desuccinylase-like protein
MKPIPTHAARVLVVLVWLAVAAALPGQVVVAPAESAVQVERYRQAVSDLAAPAMEGRGPGTQGLDRARDYLVAALREAGLTPAFAQRSSYTQRFEVSMAPKVEELALDLVPRGGEAQQTQPARHVVAMGFSGSGAFDAPVAFVGYGVVSESQKYDSYAGAGEDVLRGKVALALRYEPMDGEGQSQWTQQPGRWTPAAGLMDKARHAAQRGAVALLVVNPPGAAGAGLIQTARSGGGDSSIPVLQVDAAWLQQAAAQVDLVALQRRADAGAVIQDLPLTARGSVRLVRPNVPVDNVAAIIPGAGALDQEWVVLGAHYDHLGYGDFGSLADSSEPTIHHGADDNASGTAAVLLAARELRQQAADADAGPRRNVLIVFFTAEERGLLGATHLLGHLDDAGIEVRQIAAMVNLDMVGRMKDDVLHVMGGGTGDGLASQVAQAGEGLNLRIKAQDVAPGGSDHVAFHIKGIPAVHLFTGSHSDYHRPSDTADKINAQGGALVATYAARLTHDLAVAPQRLAFVAQQAFAHGGPGGPSGGASLGVMPDYASLEGEDGAIITGVMPGSAAEQGGLHSGDVITGWDGRPVNNVRHLTELLRQAKPGQTVRLTVRRGAQTQTLTVTLRGR